MNSPTTCSSSSTRSGRTRSQPFRDPAHFRTARSVPKTCPRPSPRARQPAPICSSPATFTPLTDSNRRPPPYHRAARGKCGQSREAAGTNAAQEEGIARTRVTAGALCCPRWCSLSVPLDLAADSAAPEVRGRSPSRAPHGLSGMISNVETAYVALRDEGVDVWQRTRSRRRRGRVTPATPLTVRRPPSRHSVRERLPGAEATVVA